MHLQGTIAVVTGAAQGLGKAFSEALLMQGASVCISDVQMNKGKELEKEFQDRYGKNKALFVHCDVKSEPSFSNLFKEVVAKFGHVNLVVNNAGIANEFKPRDTIDINLMAVIKGTELAIEYMRRDKGGKGGAVINVASTAGLIPFHLAPVYAASKHGVVGFTNSWAGNPIIKGYGIQFACLCPAFTRTAMVDFAANKTITGTLEEIEAFVNKIGLNEIEDVVDGFLKLVADDNLNGDVLTVVKGQGSVYAKKNGRSVKPKI